VPKNKKSTAVALLPRLGTAAPLPRLQKRETVLFMHIRYNRSFVPVKGPIEPYYGIKSHGTLRIYEEHRAAYSPLGKNPYDHKGHKLLF